VVDIIPYQKLNNAISLEKIKQDPYLSSISLLKQQRLSVAPITPEEYEYIIKLSQ
jgi:predicted RNA-binding protein with PUA-like domain